MNDVLIHIGYHKTGTSWLQRHVFTADSNVFRPLSHRRRGMSTLARKFIRGEDRYLLSPYETNEDVIRADLAAILAKDPDDERVPALTSERLSSSPHAAGFDAPIVARRLHRIFPNAHILICIREQRSWLLSNYFQYLRVGGTKSLRTYMTEKYDSRRPGFSPKHVDYLPLVADYIDLFGADNVTVLPYELFKSDKLQFLERIAEPFGRTIELDPSLFEVRVHSTQHEFLLYRLRLLNLLRYRNSVNDRSPFANPISRAFVTRFTSQVGAMLPAGLDSRTLASLGRQIDALIGDRYQQSNRALSELIEEDLSRYGYHAP